MINGSDRDDIQQRINELGRKAGIPDLVGLLRGAGMERGRDLAENYKPGGDLAPPYKPGGDLLYKPGGDLARLLESGALDLPSVQSLSELANALAALTYARTITKSLREVQRRLSGEDRASIEKGVNYLETQLDHIQASIIQSAAASSGPSAGSGNGRNVHLHLHLGV
jgi:hypothetical protein